MKLKTIMFTALILALSACALAQGGFTISGTPNNEKAKEPETPKKGMPMAKTQEELDAFNTAKSGTTLPEKEKAATAFQEKYAESELRSVLWSSLMQQYLNSGNASKTVEMGHKVLAMDKDNVVAQVLTAHAMTFTIRTSDLDKDEKLAEAQKLAEAAIAGMDTNLLFPPNTTPEQISGFKKRLISMALSTLGDVANKKDDYATSEKYYLDAIKTDAQDVDATTYFLLAVAQDHLKKFNEAMKNIDEAIKLFEPGSSFAKKAENEKERLKQQMTPPPSK